MTLTDTAIPAATAWMAAVAAVDAATAGVKDEAIAALMAVENRIDLESVKDLADAELRLRIALAMAGRQGNDSAPEWVLVSDALAFLQNAEATGN